MSFSRAGVAPSRGSSVARRAVSQPPPPPPPPPLPLPLHDTNRGLAPTTGALAPDKLPIAPAAVAAVPAPVLAACGRGGGGGGGGSRIHVAVRVRPENDADFSAASKLEESTELCVRCTGTGAGGGERDGRQALELTRPFFDPREFRFDRVLPPGADQAETYDATAANVVEGFLAGYNGVVMAYGKTGSGKTHTMFGGGGWGERSRGGSAAASAADAADFAEMEGVVPRAVRHACEHAEGLAAAGVEVQLTFSLLQVSNLRAYAAPAERQFRASSPEERSVVRSSFRQRPDERRPSLAPSLAAGAP